MSFAIDVQNVSVAYRTYHERPSSLKELFLRQLKSGAASRFSTFKALDAVSFQLKKGSVLGILGSNGSGKSTLLKVLAQVLKPTSGKAKVEGEISSLIELGAGFDPELTAVENIYLNGSLHRRSEAQIRERVQHILEFAELSDFATKPVKYFSSGMYARLGFSVAVDIDPEILLVDEILSVGDERFQEKCKRVFENFIQQGKTIVIVSHDIEMLRARSNQMLLLSKGKSAFFGDPHRAIELYRAQNYETALAGS